MLRFPFFVAAVLMVVSIVACSSIPTATPIPPTATSIPSTATPIPPTSSPTPAGPSAAPTAPPNLKKDTLQFDTVLSEDDYSTFMDNLQNLPGIKDITTNGQVIQVTYDPDKITLEQIISAIESYGFHVKK